MKKGMTEDKQLARRLTILRLWDEGKSFGEIRRHFKATENVMINHSQLSFATGYIGGIGRENGPITKENAQRAGVLGEPCTVPNRTKSPKKAKAKSKPFELAPMMIAAAKEPKASLEYVITEARRVMAEQQISKLEITATSAKAHKVESITF